MQIHPFFQVILSKYSSFKEEMEGAWLMKTDGPLQCCSRKIIGYIAHGNFCQTLGKGAGIGWVALRSLNFLQLCRKVYDEQTESNNESQEFLESRRESKGEYFVLVRNPSNLHYRWAKLSIILQPQWIKWYTGWIILFYISVNEVILNRISKTFNAEISVRYKEED